MRFQKLALALLCGGVLAGPAFAQSATTTAAPKPAAPATTATVPATPAPATKPATSPAAAAAATTTPAATTAPATPAATATTAPVGALTNINTASAKDLDKLPLIGKARAAAIIKNRPYKTTDELVSKKAISQSVFDKIKDKITTG